MTFSFTLTQPEGEDDLKKRQLMELAILNGTYRDTKSGSGGSASSPNHMGTAGAPGATAGALNPAILPRKSPHHA